MLLAYWCNIKDIVPLQLFYSNIKYKLKDFDETTNSLFDRLLLNKYTIPSFLL